MRVSVDSITNFGLLVSSVILAASLSVRLVDQFQSRGARRPIEPYKVGEMLPPIPGFPYATAERTLVLAVRSTCQFCSASMPFYKKLLSDKKLAMSGLRVVAVSTEPIDVTKNYFRSFGIDMPHIQSMAAGQLRVEGTPTLLLTNSSGVLQDAWVGLIKEDRESVIIDRLNHESKGETNDH